MTEPQLPVGPGVKVTLNCDAGHINQGGQGATCRNGVLVPTNGPPDCHGEALISIYYTV